ncbi:MAG: hypothetical protein ACR2JE_05375 [Acidobacteriaceae bacterium]
MTRREILQHVVLQARANGFPFRSWFKAYVDPEWEGFAQAIDVLAERRRYYMLLFSHEFAVNFWKAGVQTNLLVPAVSYSRRDRHGNIVTVHRRAFSRRTLRADSWRYHLREMAAAPEPLKYIRRYVVLKEDLFPPPPRLAPLRDLHPRSTQHAQRFE